MSVFKAYDIRGIVPKEINRDFAYNLGLAFGTLRQRELVAERRANKKEIEKPQILVSRDMRLSSEDLAVALIEGLVKTGCDVIYTGILSTPNFYFINAAYGYDGGVVITASHNPAEYNGFKMVRGAALPIGRGTGMEEVERIFNEKDFILAGEIGEVKEFKDSLKEFVQYNLHESGMDVDSSLIGKYKIVTDTANAMGIQYIDGLFENLGQIELVKMNGELDGTFPAHEADPFKPENCVDIARRVVTEKADLGITTDGDGDRVFFVDDRGRVMPPSILRGLVAQSVLKKNPGARICYDIRPGKITEDMIRAAGGVPVVSSVGHSIIKDVAIKEKCAFAGESSGHFFVVRDNGVYEDPLFVILTLLKHMTATGKKLSEIIAQYDIYFHSGEVNFKVKDVSTVLRAIKEKYKDGEINMLDGVTVTFRDWWFNVRGSNTEPLVRINVESRDKNILDKNVQEITEIIKSFQ